MVIPGILLLLLSIPFVVSDLDLLLEEPFYNHATGQWEAGEAPLWRGLYVLGPIPAIALAIVSGIVFVLGLGVARLAKFRKLAGYFFAVLLIGSGLITNAILKDHWGRPRPSQVEEFNGAETFERLLHIDPTSDGKSFPCGHATIGFFFLALVPILRGPRRWVALALALLFGTLIGIARMTQGGHFASDVIWAAAVMWFTVLAFYKLLHLDRGLYWQAPADSKPPPGWLAPLLSVTLLALIILGTTIWPYDKTLRIVREDSEIARTLPQDFTLDFRGEDILEIREGATFTITSTTDGHRAPKSKLRGRANREGRLLKVDYERKGLFSELNVHTIVTVPPQSRLQIIATEELSTLLLPLGANFELLETTLDPATKVVTR